MKLLLTGANGFIGSYFKDKYAEKYEMRFFSFLSDDFTTTDMTNIDTVIHLSALVHHMSGVSKEEYERVNIVQTLELAKKAKKNAIKHFIFMSTIKVCGEETDTPYTEKSDYAPQDDYGKSKLQAEVRLQELEDENFKITIIRTPIVYGHNVKANIKSLISLVSKVAVLPFGDISNKRSMVYVGNLCHLIDTLIAKQNNGIFLACDDYAISTRRLMELIARELNRKVFFIRIPLFKRILKFVKPVIYKRLYENLEIDNSRTKEMLDFKNLYQIEEGVKYTIHGENILL